MSPFSLQNLNKDENHLATSQVNFDTNKDRKKLKLKPDTREEARRTSGIKANLTESQLRAVADKSALAVEQDKPLNRTKRNEDDDDDKTDSQRLSTLNKLRQDRQKEGKINSEQQQASNSNYYNSNNHEDDNDNFPAAEATSIVVEPDFASGTSVDSSSLDLEVNSIGSPPSEVFDRSHSTVNNQANEMFQQLEQQESSRRRGSLTMEKQAAPATSSPEITTAIAATATTTSSLQLHKIDSQLEKPQQQNIATTVSATDAANTESAIDSTSNLRNNLEEQQHLISTSESSQPIDLLRQNVSFVPEQQIMTAGNNQTTSSSQALDESGSVFEPSSLELSRNEPNELIGTHNFLQFGLSEDNNNRISDQKQQSDRREGELGGSRENQLIRLSTNSSATKLTGLKWPKRNLNAILEAQAKLRDTMNQLHYNKTLAFERNGMPSNNNNNNNSTGASMPSPNNLLSAHQQQQQQEQTSAIYEQSNSFENVVPISNYQESTKGAPPIIVSATRAPSSVVEYLNHKPGNDLLEAADEIHQRQDNDNLNKQQQRKSGNSKQHQTAVNDGSVSWGLRKSNHNQQNNQTNHQHHSAMGSQASGSVRDVVYATSSSFANPASGERIRSRNRTLTATTLSTAPTNLTNLVTLTTSSPMSAAYEDIVTWTPAAGPAAYRAGSGYQPLSSLRQDKPQKQQDSFGGGVSFNASTDSLNFYNAPLAQNHNYSDYSIELPSTSSSASESSASITSTNRGSSNNIRYKNSNHLDTATPSNEYFANETRHTEFTAPPPIQYEAPAGSRNKDGFRTKTKSQSAKLVFSPSSSNQNEQQQQQNNQIDQYSPDQLQSSTQSNASKAKKTQDDEDGEEDQDDEENEDSSSSSDEHQSNSLTTDTLNTPSMPNILATKEQRRFKPKLPSSGHSSSAEIDQPSYNDSNNSEKAADSNQEDSYNNNNDITSGYKSKSSKSKTLPGTRKPNVESGSKHNSSSSSMQWSPTLIPITRGSEPSSVIESSNNQIEPTNGRQDDIIVGTRTTYDINNLDDGRNNDQTSPVDKMKSHHHSSSNGFKSSPPIIRTFRVADSDNGLIDSKQLIVNNSMSFGGLEPARGSGLQFDKSTKFQAQSQTLYPSASGRYNSNLSFDQPMKSSSWHNVNNNNINQRQSINGYSQQATTKSNFIPQNPNYQSYNNNFQPNLQPFNQIQHHDTSIRGSQSNSFNNNFYRPQAHYERNNPMQSGPRHSNYLEEQQHLAGGSFRQPSTNNNQVVSAQPVRPSSSMHEQQSIAHQGASNSQQASSQQNNGSWSIVTLPYPQPTSQAHNYFSMYQNDKNYPHQQQQSTYDNKYRIQSGSDDQRRPSTLWFNNAEPSSFQSTRASFSESSSNQRPTNNLIQQSSHLDSSQQQQQQQQQTNSMMYNMPIPYLSSQQQKSSPSESQLVQRGTRNAPGQSPFVHSTSSSNNNGNDNGNSGNGNDYVTINLKTHSTIGPNQLFWEAAAREVAQSSSQQPSKIRNSDETSKVPVTNGHLAPQHREPLPSVQQTLPMMRRPLAAMRYSMGQEPFASGSHTNGHAYAGQLKATHLAAAAMFDQFNGAGGVGGGYSDGGGAFAQLHTMPSNPHELSYVSPQSFMPMSFAPPNQMGETDSFNYMSAAAAMPASAFAALPTVNGGQIGTDQDGLLSPSSIMAANAHSFDSLANNYSSNNDSRFLKKGAGSAISAALPLATPSAVRDAFGWPMGYGSEAARSLLKVNHVAPPPSYLIPAKVTAAQTSALLYPTIIDPSSTNTNTATNGLPIKEDPSIITTAPGGPNNLGSLGSYASESTSDFVTWPMIAQHSVVSPQVWPGPIKAQDSMMSSSSPSQGHSYQVKPNHIKVELSTRPPQISRRMKLWQLIRLLGRRNNNSNNLNSNTSNNSTILSRTSLATKNKRQKRSIVNTIVASLTKQANNSVIGSKLTIRGRDKMFASESQTSYKQVSPLLLPTKLAIVDDSDYNVPYQQQNHQKISNSAFIPLIDNANMIDNMESDLLAQALFFNQQQQQQQAANGETTTMSNHLSMANSSPLNMMVDPMMMSASPSMRVVSHTPMNTQHAQQSTLETSSPSISGFYTIPTTGKSNLQQTTNANNGASNHNHQLESSPVVYMPIEESVGLSPPANEPSAFAEMNSNKQATSSRERLKQLSKSIIKSSKKPLTKLMKMTNLSARLVGSGAGNSITTQLNVNNQSNSQTMNNNNNQILGNSASGSQQYFSVAGYKMINPIIGQNMQTQQLDNNYFNDFSRFNSISPHHQHWYQQQQQQQQYQPPEMMNDQFRTVTIPEFASHQHQLAAASSFAPYSTAPSINTNQSSKQMFPPMVHFNRLPPSQTFNSSPLSASVNQQLSKFVAAVPTAIAAASSSLATPSASISTTTTTTTTTQTPRITMDQPTQSAAQDLVSNASFGNPLSAADEISPNSVFYLEPDSQRRLINVAPPSSAASNDNAFKPMLSEQDIRSQNALSRAISDLQLYEKYQLGNLMPLMKLTKTSNSNLPPEAQQAMVYGNHFIPPHRSSLAYEPIMRTREKQPIFPRPPKRDLLSNPARRFKNNLGEIAFGDISTVRRQASEFDDRFALNTTPIFRVNTQNIQPFNSNNAQNESSRSIYNQNSNNSLGFDHLAQLSGKQAISNLPYFKTPKQQSANQQYIFTQTKPKLRIQVGHQAGILPQVLVRPKTPFKQNSVILNTFKPAVKTTRQFSDNSESGALSLLYGKNSAKNSTNAFSEGANEMFANSMETALSNQDLPRNDLEAAKMLVASGQNQLGGDQSSSQLDENSFNSLITSASSPIEDPAAIMPQPPNAFSGTQQTTFNDVGGNTIVEQKPGENVGDNVQLSESSSNNGDFTLEQQQQFQHSLNQQQLQNQMFQIKPNLAYQINPSNLPKPRLPKFIPSINSMASKFRQHLFQTLRLNPLGSRWPTMLGSASFMTYPKFQPNSNLIIPLSSSHHQLDQQQQQMQQPSQQQQFMPQPSNQHSQPALDGSNMYNFASQTQIDDVSMNRVPGKLSGFQEPAAQANQFVSQQPQQNQQQVMQHQHQFQHQQKQLMMPPNRLSHQMRPHNLGSGMTNSNKHPTMQLDDSGLATGEDGRLMFPENGNTIDGEGSHHATSSSSSIPTMEREPNLLEFSAANSNGTAPMMMDDIASGADIYDQELMNQHNATNEFTNQMNEQQVAELSESAAPLAPPVALQPARNVMTDVSNNLVTSDGTYIPEEQPANQAPTSNQENSFVNASSSIRDDRREAPPTPQAPFQTQSQHEQQAQALRNNVPDGNITIHHHHVIAPDDLDSENKIHEMQMAIRNQQQHQQSQQQPRQLKHQPRPAKQQHQPDHQLDSLESGEFNYNQQDMHNSSNTQNEQQDNNSVGVDSQHFNNLNQHDNSSFEMAHYEPERVAPQNRKYQSTASMIQSKKVLMNFPPHRDLTNSANKLTSPSSSRGRSKETNNEFAGTDSQSQSQINQNQQINADYQVIKASGHHQIDGSFSNASPQSMMANETADISEFPQIFHSSTQNSMIGSNGSNGFNNNSFVNDEQGGTTISVNSDSQDDSSEDQQQQLVGQQVYEPDSQTVIYGDQAGSEQQLNSLGNLNDESPSPHSYLDNRVEQQQSNKNFALISHHFQPAGIASSSNSSLEYDFKPVSTRIPSETNNFSTLKAMSWDHDKHHHIDPFKPVILTADNSSGSALNNYEAFNSEQQPGLRYNNSAIYSQQQRQHTLNSAGVASNHEQYVIVDQPVLLTGSQSYKSQDHNSASPISNSDRDHTTKTTAASGSNSNLAASNDQPVVFVSAKPEKITLTNNNNRKRPLKLPKSAKARIEASKQEQLMLQAGKPINSNNNQVISGDQKTSEASLSHVTRSAGLNSTISAPDIVSNSTTLRAVPNTTTGIERAKVSQNSVDINIKNHNLKATTVSPVILISRDSSTRAPKAKIRWQGMSGNHHNEKHSNNRSSVDSQNQTAAQKAELNSSETNSRDHAWIVSKMTHQAYAGSSGEQNRQQINNTNSMNNQATVTTEVAPIVVDSPVSESAPATINLGPISSATNQTPSSGNSSTQQVKHYSNHKQQHSSSYLSDASGLAGAKSEPNVQPAENNNSAQQSSMPTSSSSTAQQQPASSLPQTTTLEATAAVLPSPDSTRLNSPESRLFSNIGLHSQQPQVSNSASSPTKQVRNAAATYRRFGGNKNRLASNNKAESAVTPTTASPAGVVRNQDSRTGSTSFKLSPPNTTTATTTSQATTQLPAPNSSGSYNSATSPMSIATARASIEEVAEIVHLQPTQQTNSSASTSVLNERPTVFTGAINLDLGEDSASSLLPAAKNQSSSSSSSRFLSRSGNLAASTTTISSVDNNELNDDTTSFRQHYLKEEDENNPAIQSDRLSHIRNRRQKERDDEEAQKSHHQRNQQQQQQQTEAEDVDLRIKLITKQNKDTASTMTAGTKSGNKRYSSASAGAERTFETNEMNDMISIAGKHSSD